jgi:Tfp pilus assembly protein PilN
MKAVNLLPPDQRGASSKASAVPAASQPGGAGAYAVLGALAIGVVAAAGLVLTGNNIKDRQAQLDALTAREQAVQAQVGDLKPYADFATLAASRVATVMDLAGRRFDWENALRDLSRAIPANVTLTTMTGSVSPESGGTGGSALRGAISAPAITLAGCTASQPAVAKLMARLRTVDGVTRVSLAKSTKAPAAPAQVADSAPAGASAGCRSGESPTFEMVAFFERAADATAAPSDTPAVTTPASTTPAGSATTTPASTTQGETK